MTLSTPDAIFNGLMTEEENSAPYPASPIAGEEGCLERDLLRPRPPGTGGDLNCDYDDATHDALNQLSNSSAALIYSVSWDYAPPHL
jgi:hypothetical protein